MAKHRNHSIEFKRQVVQDYLSGETRYGLAKRPFRKPVSRAARIARS